MVSTTRRFFQALMLSSSGSDSDQEGLYQLNESKITAFLVLAVCHSWVASLRLSVIVVILHLDTYN